MKYLFVLEKVVYVEVNIKYGYGYFVVMEERMIIYNFFRYRNCVLICEFYYKFYCSLLVVFIICNFGILVFYGRERFFLGSV